jgi:glutamate synthase domain-containing protein 2
MFAAMFSVRQPCVHEAEAKATREVGLLNTGEGGFHQRLRNMRQYDPLKWPPQVWSQRGLSDVRRRR